MHAFGRNSVPEGDRMPGKVTGGGDIQVLLPRATGRGRSVRCGEWLSV